MTQSKLVPFPDSDGPRRAIAEAIDGMLHAPTQEACRAAAHHLTQLRARYPQLTLELLTGQINAFERQRAELAAAITAAHAQQLTKPRSTTERILQLWQLQPCAVCSQRGACPHREMDCATAALEAEDRRAAREAKP
jgi:hypothetical protein